MRAALLALVSGAYLRRFSAPSATDSEVSHVDESEPWRDVPFNESWVHGLNQIKSEHEGRSVPKLAATWYINLDAFKGRQAKMEAAYKMSGLRYQRFPALRPTTASLKAGGEFNYLYNAYHPDRHSDLYDENLVARIRGEVGCIASHLYLLRHIKNTGRPGEVYLLAEDDFIPGPSFNDRLPTALSLLPPDWDALRLDCWQAEGQDIHKFPEISPGLFWNSIPGCSAKDSQPGAKKECYFCGGTHAVLVPYEKVDRMIGLWTGANGPLFPLDCMMNRPDFKNYCLQWSLFKQVPDFTSKPGSIPKSADKVTKWHLK